MLVLSECLAWLDCRVWSEHEAGDHRIIVGEAVECGATEEGEPLVFYRGEYGTVAT
jgi:flavin reductase (DIM6/NTAB) family NADH-FMN oxidoreductase RutF